MEMQLREMRTFGDNMSYKIVSIQIHLAMAIGLLGCISGCPSHDSPTNELTLVELLENQPTPFFKFERIKRDSNGNVTEIDITGLHLTPKQIEELNQMTTLESLNTGDSNVSYADLMSAKFLSHLKILFISGDFTKNLRFSSY